MHGHINVVRANSVIPESEGNGGTVTSTVLSTLSSRISKKVTHARKLECLNCRRWTCGFGRWRSGCQAGCTNAYFGTPARNWLSYSYKWRKLDARHASA